MFELNIQRFLDRHHYQCIKPRAALIDMDGTLYDSMPNHAEAWHRMVSELGLPSDPYNYFLWEGRIGKSVINELFSTHYGHPATDEEVERHYRRKVELFRTLPTPSPMPGAATMLTELEQMGINRVLVTGSGQSCLIGRLDTDFPGAFAESMRITAHNVNHGKPHPEPFIKAMQLARVSPSQALAIDNAPLGVESGHRAGAFTIGVVTGPLEAKTLEDAGADVVFPSMQALADSLPLLVLEMLRTVTI